MERGRKGVTFLTKPKSLKWVRLCIVISIISISQTLIKYLITYYCIRKGMIKVKRYLVFWGKGLEKAGNLVMVYTAHPQNKQGKNPVQYTLKNTVRARIQNGTLLHSQASETCSLPLKV